MVVWDHQAEDDTGRFQGEVLLDLQDASLQGEAVWYPLDPHDDNIGPLPEALALQTGKASEGAGGDREAEVRAGLGEEDQDLACCTGIGQC